MIIFETFRVGLWVGTIKETEKDRKKKDGKTLIISLLHKVCISVNTRRVNTFLIYQVRHISKKACLVKQAFF